MIEEDTIDSEEAEVGDDLLGVVNDDLVDTDLSTEVLDILPSIEVEGEDR